jgi:glycosyltransferase involved in cell wall biosynthesis
MGARMHYAVPALLARAEMLEHFYTDICGNVGLFKYLNNFLPSSLLPKAFQRLLGRKLPQEISRQQLTTCSVNAIMNTIYKKPKNIENKLKEKVIKDNFFQANALYTNFINSDIDLVTKAREQGLKIIHEVILNPDVGIILNEERNRFPGLENQNNWEEVQAGIERDKQKWSLSDLILVPSQFVYESITRLGAVPERIKIVPYGIDSHWFDEVPNPQKGRVLFVGSVGLRKGNHYLAQAVRLLKERSIPCEARVVGPYKKVDNSIIEHPEFRGPQYIGQVPRSEVRKEFLQADIFVLPTLSDSFALVHLEAMACGVPVITTPNCGSVVRDGVDGFIVPIRDAETLAERMEQLLTDDRLRNQMSRNAKERAKEFTWDQYCDRLLAALKELESTLNE